MGGQRRAGTGAPRLGRFIIKVAAHRPHDVGSARHLGLRRRLRDEVLHARRRVVRLQRLVVLDGLVIAVPIEACGRAVVPPVLARQPGEHLSVCAERRRRAPDELVAALVVAELEVLVVNTP